MLVTTDQFLIYFLLECAVWATTDVNRRPGEEGGRAVSHGTLVSVDNERENQFSSAHQLPQQQEAFGTRESI